MALEIITIPCLSDNYAFLARDVQTGSVALIDAPEAAPICAELAAREWTLSAIWITHHHDDHVQGLEEIKEAYPAPVYGAANDAHRLPLLDHALHDNDRFAHGATDVQIWDVSGHTIGHIAYITDGAAFTADSLMALGCGRVFEGTKPQMFESLERFKSLSRETVICSGHEYTAANGKFAQTVDPQNAALISRIKDIEHARAAGRPTVPSTLGLELDTNPYLRADNADIAAHLGMPNATPVEVFVHIRNLKDSFA